MRPDDTSRLIDIVLAAREAIELAEGATQDVLMETRTLQLSLVKLIEVIGEAASRLTGETKSAIADVPWIDIIGMRHRLVHDYMSIDYDVVWEVVQLDLPALIQSIEAAFPDLAS